MPKDVRSLLTALLALYPDIVSREILPFPRRPR
jgi:hypothetical protein